MRDAYQDKGWLLTEDGKLLGLSLGFDFCAEHERGATYIKEELGIAQQDFPIGVEDRTMTLVPAHLGFEKYDWRSGDKRFKKAVPAAILHCCESIHYATQSREGAPEGAAAIVALLRLEFSMDCLKDAASKWYKPERDDIHIKWGSTDGFAVHVRGAENVQRLEQLYDSMKRLQVSLADPAIMGFLRKSMALVINDAVPKVMRDSVRQADLAHKRLYDALEATGIKETLTAAGLRWYALSPDWRAGEGSDLLVYLNPQDQKRFSSGWFTVPELQSWAQGNGPVLKDERLEALLKEIDVDLGFHLVMGLNAHGRGLRVHSKPVWMDEAKTIPGLRLRIAEGYRHLMADGDYSLDDLTFYLTAGRRLHAEERAKAEAKKTAAEAAKQQATATN